MPTHRQSIAPELTAALEAADDAGRPIDDATAREVAKEIKVLLWQRNFDVPETLATFLDNGSFDRVLFNSALRGVAGKLALEAVDVELAVSSLLGYIDYHRDRAGSRGPVPSWNAR